MAISLVNGAPSGSLVLLADHLAVLHNTHTVPAELWLSQLLLGHLAACLCSLEPGPDPSSLLVSEILPALSAAGAADYCLGSAQHSGTISAPP